MRVTKATESQEEHAALRILHVITGLNTGGAETTLCRLLASLRPPGFHHAVVALGSEGTLSGEVASLAELHHLGMRPGRVRPGDLLRLRRMLREFRPDVVHGWMYHANLMATLAEWGSRVPVVWGIHNSLHDLASEKRATRLVIRTCALLSRRPARILYVSSVSADQHATFGFSQARVRVIPNGFDCKAFAPASSARLRVRAELDIAADALAIGLVARVHPMKDHANFLRAAAHFVAGHPRTVFVLVGDGTGEDNRELGDLIESLRLRAHVRLCGRRSDLAAVNNAFDVASSSSRGEAFPNVLGEAMACGVPCVATDVGDVREIIGDTGVVVPPRNSVALSEGWARLAALGDEGRRELGSRARERIVARYALAAVARRYAEAYADVLGTR